MECSIYEIPELQASLDWEVPTRGFKITEKEYTREETFLCMTTLPVEMADADTVRQIVHAKWCIENNAIKDLTEILDIHIKHCYGWLIPIP